MTQKAIIYLHGFNSASVDSSGHLLTSKDKLRVLQSFCKAKDIVLFAPNIDYQDFANILEDMLFEWNQWLDRGYQVTFMGSSLGGFASEYLAMLTGSSAIMINPVISPTRLLPQFMGVTTNFETGQPYQWQQCHCDQYQQYEYKLSHYQANIHRTILLDMADSLLDSRQTQAKYQDMARVVSFDGGSHSFDHMTQALAVIESVIFSN